MHDERATSAQLIEEIQALRRQVAELEYAEAKRKQTEEALHQSEAHYRTLLDNLPDAIFIHDLTGKLMDVNQEACRRLGYSRDELLQKHPRDFTQEKPHEGYEFVLKQLRTNGQAIDDSEHITKTGERIPCEIAMKLIKYHDQPVILSISRDISKRKQAEEALHQSEAALRESKQELEQLIAMVPVGIYTFRSRPDSSGCFEFMSQRAGEIFGVDPQAVLRDSSLVGDTLHPDDREDYLQTSITANQTIQQTVWEGRILVQGATRWIRVESRPYPQANGDILWHGCLMDITARRQSEEAAKEHHANLLAILENTEDIICSRDREHRLTFFNTAFANISRRLFQREAAVGLNVFALLSEAGKRHWQPILESVLAGARYHEEFEWDFGDGDVRTYEIAFNPIFKDDEVIGYSEFNRDITARKLIEQALRASEDRYQQMINLSPDAILVHVNDKIVFVNPAALQLFGFDEMRDMLGQSTIALVHPEDQPAILERRRLAMTGQMTSNQMDVKLRRKDGSLIDAALTSFTITYHGQFAIQATIRDISERKRAEEALQHAKDAAEAANRAKSIFLAKMSHELRTPLNSILGYAQILIHDPMFNSKHRETIQVIERSGQHLLAMINDILELAKVEAGRMELHPAPLYLSSLLNDIQGMMKMKAEQKGLRFQIIQESGLSEYVAGDAHRLRQILLNLLGNAIKFTDRGNVTLRVGMPFCDVPEYVGASSCVRPENEKIPLENGQIVSTKNGQTRGAAPTVQPLFFEISDTGVGIAPEDLPNLFTPFQQVGDAVRKTHGTGLGLAISRHLVELMGGTFSVASTVGCGSVFRFEIALPIIAFPASPRPSRRVIVGVHGIAPTILVVDDLAENRHILTELLTSCGCRVVEAATGEDALQQALTELPAAIITDVDISDMNGCEFIRRIRQTPACEKTVIIVSSASDYTDVREQSAAAGGHAFLAKPIQAGTLYDLLQRLGVANWCYQEETPRSASARNIPEPLIERLRTAAILADMQEIYNVVSELQEINPTLADKLAKLAYYFEYSKMVHLLIEEGNTEH